MYFNFFVRSVQFHNGRNCRQSLIAFSFFCREYFFLEMSNLHFRLNFDLVKTNEMFYRSSKNHPKIG